jgi:hypothetical protein
MRKKYFLVVIAAFCLEAAFSQNFERQTTKKTFFSHFKNHISGGLESNGQWYLDDSKTGDFEEDEAVRANSYLRVNGFFLRTLQLAYK